MLLEDFKDTVHIDENMFYNWKDRQRYYHFAEEEEPHRAVSQKTHIAKVMFFVAVAKPQWVILQKEAFDRKIGC